MSGNRTTRLCSAIACTEDMLAGYAEKILADKDQGQKIYEKLYEAKVVEDVKSKIKVTEKAVSAEDFAKLAQAL